MIRNPLALCAVSLAAVISACSGPGPKDRTVTGPSGASVVLPAGAAPSETNVSISAVSTGFPAFGTGTTAKGDVLAFTPHGQAFAVPVVVTVPFAGAAEAGLRLMTAEPGGAWTVVSDATLSGNTMTASVSHFSFFVVARKEPADAGTVGPLDGSWRLDTKACNDVALDISSWPVTTFTFANATATITNVYCTISTTVSYSAPATVDWTIVQTLCPNIDGGNSGAGDHHSATYTVVGTTLTLTEAVTPAGEYPAATCGNTRQVSTFTRQ